MTGFAPRRMPGLAALLVVLPLTVLVPAASAAPARVVAPQVTADVHHATIRPVQPVTMRERAVRRSHRVVRLVNQRRVAHGLPRVRVNHCLSAYAARWAERLARQNQFEHSNMYRLISRCNAPYVSENIAWIPRRVHTRDLVQLWMDSPGHRHNILSPSPTATGVAFAWDPDQRAWLVVQNFARRPGSYRG